ncbi:MAG: transposase, partial [Synergistaceae bacterium]|nr:transposase [Synergistaceae bacterium]
MAYDRRFLYQSSPSRSRSSRRQPSYGSYKKGLNTKIHIAVDSFGMPVRVIVTEGTVADCSRAGELIEGIDADYLLADRGYDTDNVIKQVTEAEIEIVIPPKKNRKKQRQYDKDIYENRHHVEN